MQPNVESFFEDSSNTFSYVVSDPAGNDCVIIDSVLDYDAKSGRTTTESADGIIEYIRDQGLNTVWILETHPHADHLTAAPHLQEQLGGRIGIGQGIRQVQHNFKAVYNLGDEVPDDGSQFDHLFADDEEFAVGAVTAMALATPGHTPACVTYVIGDAAFVGDTLFMPDFGSARCDFPDGDARMLYQSVKRILALPPETRLFMCHDYGPGGREFLNVSSIAEQRSDNIHLNDGVNEDEFVKMRSERDATLSMPALLLPSIQVNIRAGRFPEPEENGISYLKMPMNAV